MSTECKYGFGCRVDLSFDRAVERVERLLVQKGFKVYTRLNLHEIIENETSEKFDRYIIIGACNPDVAQKLFEADPNIGLLMPCNVVIYELRTGGCKVMIKDPARIMDMISNPIAIEASINVKVLMEEIIEELNK